MIEEKAGLGVDQEGSTTNTTDPHPEPLRPILVWSFYDAPQEYQSLSRNGGDEDWLALVPKEIADQWIAWMNEGSSFGCCSVDSYPLPNGDIVRIGSHA